ncbi:MAG: S24 family peptidase [Pseudomonadota bacterium]
MDAEWFKKKQKALGVTVHDLGEALGRDRTVVSRIYAGKQKMTLSDAGVFAEMLKAPLSEILQRAGVASPEVAHEIQIGFSEGDAAPWAGPSSVRCDEKPTRNGVDTWRVLTDAMALAGILPGDLITVDTVSQRPPKAGDIVIAQVYDLNSGTAETILRRFEKHVLVSASIHPEHQRLYVVDDNAVSIRGLVKDCWRSYE